MRHRVITNASALFSGIAVLMVTVGVSPLLIRRWNSVLQLLKGRKFLTRPITVRRLIPLPVLVPSIWWREREQLKFLYFQWCLWWRAQSASRPAASAPASGQWEIYNQLQQLQEEVQQLRGMVEQQNFEIEQLRKQQRETYRDLDMRIGRGGGSSAAAPATSGGAVAVTRNGRSICCFRCIGTRQ